MAYPSVTRDLPEDVHVCALAMEVQMTETEINAAFAEKVQRGIFNPVARFLTNPDK